MKAIIVGGGIGGLAAAVAFGRRGWDVEVYERRPEFGEVGAGLSLWPNALRALDALGVGASVRGRSVPAFQAGIRDRKGRWLTRADVDEVARVHGQVVMVHRGELLRVLLDAVPEKALRAGRTVEHADAEHGVVRFADGGESTGDLIVGADGVRSAVRRSVRPEASRPRYAGYTAWRFVLDDVPVEEGVETWGRGERFGYAPMAGGQVYCYAAANALESTADGGLDELRHRFGAWHDPIPALLQAAGPGALLRHDIYELPPLGSYVDGRVALLGDAAHAMTPNLGQGACQALEDAVVLASTVDDGAGLAAYDAARRPRTQMVVRKSREIGRIAQMSSPIGCGVRDLVMRAAPVSSTVRVLRPVMDWRP